MFDDFRKAVLAFYAEKKAAGLLPDNLVKPTRVNLKNECLKILRERYAKKDDAAIQKFFDPKNEFGNHQKALENFDLDGFQSLITFFKRDIKMRREENIKLLAWLIDFEPRPFNEEYDYAPMATTAPKPSTENPVPEGQPQPTPPEQPEKAKAPIWRYAGIAALVILAATYLNVYGPSLPRGGDASTPITNTTTTEPPVQKILVGSEKNPSTLPLQVNDKQCMFWNEDHYEAIACNQEVEGASIIALNARKLKYQKKVTNLDTIGKKDLGKTWYFRINNDSIALFTDSGSYPLDDKRLLKPLSAYMLNKYILSKR